MCGALESEAKHSTHGHTRHMILVKIKMPAFSRTGIIYELAGGMLCVWQASSGNFNGDVSIRKRLAWAPSMQGQTRRLSNSPSPRALVFK